MIRKLLILGFISSLALGALSFFLVLKDVDKDGFNYQDGDCQPFENKINPKTDEISFDGIDQNCDGKDYMEGDAADNDRDEFTLISGDCDDADASIHIGAEELNDDKDNDCDLRIDEKIVVLPLHSVPFVPSVGARQGLQGESFLRAMSAFSITGSGTIYDGYLDMTVTSQSSKAPNPGSKSIAVKMYLGVGNKDLFYPLDERYLDASWTGKGNNTLNTSEAADRGGVFFAGLVRNLRLNLRSLPVSAKSQWDSSKESINLIELLQRYDQKLIIGFYTSAPGFGVINNAIIELEVEKNAEVKLTKL